MSEQIEHIIYDKDNRTYAVETTTDESPCKHCCFFSNYTSCDHIIKKLFGYNNCIPFVGNNAFTKKYIRKLLVSNIELWKQEINIKGEKHVNKKRIKKEK